jgi:transglutaminase-like putative cysteine protease
MNRRLLLPRALAAVALACLLVRCAGEPGASPPTPLSTPAGPVRVGTLLRAVHHSVVDYAAGGEAGVLWVPLPLDYATQTPLYVELGVEPQSLLDHVEYTVDDIGNFGARVTLTADGAASRMAVHWDGVVLTRDISDAQRPAFYAATSDPTEWTAATPVADSSYAGIARTATVLAQDAASPLDRMSAVIQWTSSHITYETDWTGFSGFDASSTYDRGGSSCTGFANLATALGRAIGLPTRTLANYMVGTSQQTHSINEFYLGEELGWRRVEPQSSLLVLPENYALTVRLVRVTDEGSDAMDPPAPLDTARGIPLFTMTLGVEGSQRLRVHYADIDYFDDCAFCDNRAEVQAALIGDAETMDVLFDKARALWRRDLAAYVRGRLTPRIMDARRAALQATTLADVDAIIKAIAPDHGAGAAQTRARRPRGPSTPRASLPVRPPASSAPQ